jgi:hypothetical protein
MRVQQPAGPGQNGKSGGWQRLGAFVLIGNVADGLQQLRPDRAAPAEPIEATGIGTVGRGKAEKAGKIPLPQMPGCRAGLPIFPVFRQGRHGNQRCSGQPADKFGDFTTSEQVGQECCGMTGRFHRGGRTFGAEQPKRCGENKAALVAGFDIRIGEADDPAGRCEGEMPVRIENRLLEAVRFRHSRFASGDQRDDRRNHRSCLPAAERNHNSALLPAGLPQRAPVLSAASLGSEPDADRIGTVRLDDHCMPHLPPI